MASAKHTIPLRTAERKKWPREVPILLTIYEERCQSRLVGRLMMRAWRNPFLAIVALVALTATTLPVSAWFCPVTGRIGSAATVCAMPGGTGISTAGASGNDSSRTSMPCCAKVENSQCCKSLPQVPNGSGQTSTLALPHADSASILNCLAKAAPTGVLAAILPYRQFIKPIGGLYSFGFRTLRPLSQNAPPTNGSRAPPLS